MPKENLSSYLSFYSPTIISIRERLISGIDADISKGALENTLSFNSKNMYECWVNYSPFFFREMKKAFESLTERGFSSEKIAGLVENKFRVLRYVPQLLIPGGFLDLETPDAEKKDFLEKFAIVARSVISDKGYNDSDIDVLPMEPLSPRKKISFGRLIEILKEATEKIYFGEQPIGIPMFGLDRKAHPEHYAVLRDFDLNLGQRAFPKIPKVKTIIYYSQFDNKQGPFFMYLDRTHAQLFARRFWETDEYFVSPPLVENIDNASIKINGREISYEDADRLTADISQAIREIHNLRTAMTPFELNREYCFIQSVAIRNMQKALGNSWEVPRDAQSVMAKNAILDKLKSEYNLRYAHQVALELIRRSVHWAKEFKN